MASDDKKTEENNETQGGQETHSQEDKKETSDVELLLKSNEKMKKVDVSHMNFAEAAKKEKPREIKTESDTSESTTSNEQSGEDE